MGIIEDVMKALDRIPTWKRLQTAPAQLDALERRIAAIEARLSPAAGEICPKCRALTYRLVESKKEDGPFGDLGAMQDHFACSSCQYTNVISR